MEEGTRKKKGRQEREGAEECASERLDASLSLHPLHTVSHAASWVFLVTVMDG